MAGEILRYQVRTKSFLCMTPYEALTSGIVVGEQIIEELLLVKNPGHGYEEYAALRKENEEDLRLIPVPDRGEAVFPIRNEAVEYVRVNGPDKFQLYGVLDRKTVDRDQIKQADDQDLEDFLAELGSFGKLEEN